MKNRYLEVTYRQGKPLAAYLYLPRRDGDLSARVDHGPADLLVDRASDGRAIGIEISEPSLVTLDELNKLLVELEQEPLSERGRPAYRRMMP